MKTRLKKPLTALMMAWGTYLAILSMFGSSRICSCLAKLLRSVLPIMTSFVIAM